MLALAVIVSNLDTNAVFRLRDYQPKDLEKLYRLDQECFEAGISYSRAELRSFIERHGSFCVVAELENDWTSDASIDPEENGPTLSPKEGDKGRAQKDPTLSSKQVDRVRAQSKKFEKGTMAGFIVAELHPKGYGHIVTIDVRQEFRRLELGSTLLVATEERLRKQNAFMVVLEVAVNNRAAITFYKRHQFNVARTIPRYYKDELDAFLMTKRL
jgi:ribosomal protein S18 acetylase RimI-like enzyme